MQKIVFPEKWAQIIPMGVPLVEGKIHLWHLYYSAWRAIKFRFDSCLDSEAEFEKLMLHEKVKSGENEYEIEKHLYSFFHFGLSSVESFYFASYMVGAMKKPNDSSITVTMRIISIELVHRKHRISSIRVLVVSY